MKNKTTIKLWAVLLAVIFILGGCGAVTKNGESTGVKDELSGVVSDALTTTQTESESSVSIDEVPEFDESTPFVTINNNVPEFTDGEKKMINAYEEYSKLDELGRCGTAFAVVCKATMPTEERGAIGQIKPSGWHTVKYDCVDGGYLYNRCHLIGYQLTAENSNKRNLITGTRYMNIEGMLPFEDMVADYVDETSNHVLYKVTPIFKGDNLVASGVHMQAYSVEDGGEGISFNVYCYNAQPDIIIDYSNGDSSPAGDKSTTTKKTSAEKEKTTAAKEASQKDNEAAAEYYWTENGTVYHKSKDCRSLAKSKDIKSGTTPPSGRKLCKICGK